MEQDNVVQSYGVRAKGRSLASMVLAAVAKETNIKPSTIFSLSVDDKTGNLLLKISRKINSQCDGKLVETSGEVPGNGRSREGRFHSGG